MTRREADVMTIAFTIMIYVLLMGVLLAVTGRDTLSLLGL